MRRGEEMAAAPYESGVSGLVASLHFLNCAISSHNMKSQITISSELFHSISLTLLL